MIFFGMVTTSKSGRYTTAALDSFFAHTNLQARDRFFLIDNDCDFATPSNPQIEIIRNAKPMSFAANVNQVIHRAMTVGADVLFMNNDVIFTSEWLPPLLDVSNCIVLPVSNQQYMYKINDFALREAMDLEEYSGHETELKTIVAERRSRPEARTVHDFLRVSFFCFRLPSEVYRAIGLFDEGFGTGGGEDTDYQVRALLGGFKVRSVGASYLLHFAGKSTYRGVETEQEVAAKRRQYTTRFREKWGRDVADVFLLGPSGQHVIDRLELANALAHSDYKTIAEVCLRASRAQQNS